MLIFLFHLYNYYAFRSHSNSFTASKPIKRLNFVQMVLQNEEKGEEGGETVFSPVLIWKPGSRQGRRRKRKESRRSGDETGQQDSCKTLPLKSDGGGPTTPPLQKLGHKGGKAMVRNFVALKRMDLTDALPPEKTGSATERKVSITERREG